MCFSARGRLDQSSCGQYAALLMTIRRHSGQTLAHAATRRRASVERKIHPALRQEAALRELEEHAWEAPADLSHASRTGTDASSDGEDDGWGTFSESGGDVAELQESPAETYVNHMLNLLYLLVLTANQF